jgi:hypothetical protein
LLQEKRAKEQRQREELQTTAAIFGNLATLTRTGNKELFEIGKAAAFVEATVQGALAIQKALASAPPPLNFALAASVGVATGVQLATISAQKLQTGIDSVPGIGTADNFPALLAPGERVVPARTNEDLTSFLASQENNTEILLSINESLANIQPQVSVRVGEDELVNTINDSLDSGRELAV